MWGDGSNAEGATGEGDVGGVGVKKGWGRRVGKGESSMVFRRRLEGDNGVRVVSGGKDCCMKCGGMVVECGRCWEDGVECPERAGEREDAVEREAEVSERSGVADVGVEEVGSDPKDAISSRA